MRKDYLTLSSAWSIFFPILMIVLINGLTVCSGQVKVSELTVSIPTYLKNPPQVVPRYYFGGAHQGVQRRIYPYPMDDVFTNNKEDKEYNIIHVENKFIDIGIMPSEGGRIYHAEDKTNDYNFIYHNHVIKPALVGMIGDWRTGSLAWGFPHHHGPNTVRSMDYKITENTNGSKTIWLADFDLRHRMSILIGYTFYPSSSIIEMTIFPMNRTSLGNSFLFWANPAVIADTTYQVIFPPSVQYVTFHAKRDITTWPIADCEFGGYDFTGLDISKWKNTRVPSSFFSWDPREGYFAGYNHGKDAGTVWVGNRYICPGMKFWADGNNPAGVEIRKYLTDDDGPNIELMAGMYTDNQPDYSWIEPYESKYGTMIWFPIRELGGIKYANRNGALNLEVTGDQVAQIRMNSTSPQKDAEVVLESKGQTLFRRKINISPAEPFKTNVPLPAGLHEDDLHVALYGQNGEILLSYKPAEHHPPDYERPEPLKPLVPPEELNTVEELYLAGLRLNQFYNAGVDPMPYYVKALKLDPANYRVNTQLGILNIKDFKWEEAEKNLHTAVERITSNYTRPKDCEGLYYLGIVLRANDKTDEAYDCFYQATWGSAWHSAAYYQLAEIDCQREDYYTALDHLERSISTNLNNLKALNLKVIVLRKIKDFEAARQQLTKNLSINVIDHQALNELYILNNEAGKNKEASDYLTELTTIMRDEVQSYLELATDYGNCGLYQEAIDILSRLERKGNNFPMLYYFLGYYWSKIGEQDKVIKYYQMASKMPYHYCFPFRAEEIVILRHAMELNPGDSRAPYYLGNLLYEHQPENAITEWEKSRQLDESFYIVHRNLAEAYKDVLKDNVKALASMERAIALNNDDPRLLYEYDELCDINKASSQKKYEFMKQNYETARKSSETLLRLATRAVEYGKYNEAIDILTDHDIAECEGGRERIYTYIKAFTLRGMEYLKRGKYNEALRDFEILLAYPRKPPHGYSAQLYYMKGLVYEGLGKPEIAETFFQKTLSVEILARRGPFYREYVYYHGLALIKLGKPDEARKVFLTMLDDTQKEKEAILFFTQFERGPSRDDQIAHNHYLTGLAYKGLGDFEKAKAEFNSALQITLSDVWFNSHIWSKVHLDSL